MNEKKVLNKEIGNIIRKLRKEKNYTISELAQKLSMQSNYLQTLEQGINNPTIYTIYKINKVIPLIHEINKMFEKNNYEK